MRDTVAIRLRQRYDSLTVSERMIAGWLLDNLHAVPFETAASIGARVGVSAMTVGRLLKSLGYAGMAALKDDLRDDLQAEHGEAPWLLAPTVGADARLKAETAAIADVYARAETPEWAAVVALLASAGSVLVAGFQTERGLAAGFAHHLGYVRPAVRSLDAGTGLYAELDEATAADVLVLVDLRRYSRHFRLLAEAAVARGVPLVVVTDPYCPWARDLTPHILTAEVALGHFWDMNTALAALLNLLVDDVVRVIGAERVHARLATLSDNYDRYVGFQPRGR
ncbi:MurR/RpiR family transcriptional regulator [Polymorphobacter fuscus]|uniref:MurR/RpiR family transcriptional regulator n=1 Tax=Sandarakinorhabdus fusca TaxID=1439888 RepID=A0A7C9GM89_9SPHN|nr:MurR/RpiR family transcriptional regulator [Polymorphobacter fuscus]KAB7648212.1 MurR/RpiR family transcriptional regulator [Polymorphobacter fuscus]MQT15715.1 MurR/RpiR family transcriptional regulator [Polymorphobacter fuscus]NJC08014.1 DNA-binding MurR/RpiR family transcriptional regulator [Polymorphobacter fuscus]